MKHRPFKVEAVYSGYDEVFEAIKKVIKTDPEQAFIMEMQAVTSLVIQKYIPLCKDEHFIENFCNALAAVNVSFIHAYIQGDKSEAVFDFAMNQHIAMQMLIKQITSPPKEEQH